MNSMRWLPLAVAFLGLLCGGSLVAQARGGGGHSGRYSHSYSGSHSYTSRAGGHVNSRYHYTHSYVRSNGTYVRAYHATDPNGTLRDNYSTRGNVNPWTGKPGTKPAD